MEKEVGEIYQAKCLLPKQGNWCPPTLFLNVSQSHRIVQEEIFGPVLAVQTFRTIDEVIEKARKGAHIQRYKGLGEMNPDQLWETTMNPENRVLIQVRIDDIDTASEYFELFMGNEVEPRRDYIQTHAKDVENLDV